MKEDGKEKEQEKERDNKGATGGVGGYKRGDREAMKENGCTEGD